MKLGVVLRLVNTGYDHKGIGEFVQNVEDPGYDYLLAYDLVTKTEGSPPPTSEPFVLFSYLAGLTRGLEFAVGVLILPSRQTVLVAKQAAELDLLSDGRLRLGVAVGWNESEYQAMNSGFHSRGKRIEEQITVLRELWTKPLVRFKGEYHNMDGIGIDPLPVQRPIPIWLGGYSDSVLNRVARAYNDARRWGTNDREIARLCRRIRTHDGGSRHRCLSGYAFLTRLEQVC
ncbi:MAG: TIGR03619 family F420-dependent LLM class oxidoreductase [Candidatus Thorarchaeota archaeon]